MPLLGEKQKERHMSKIKEKSIMDKPDEKCLKFGPEHLTDAELLSVILRTGTAGQNVLELSNKLISKDINKPSICTLNSYTYESLMTISGVGKVKALQILALCELSKRMSATPIKTGMILNTSELIANCYMEEMRHLKHEQLKVLFLDTKCRLIKEKTMTVGTINQSLISPREIFVEAFNCNAVNMVLLHNHPSGDSKPSVSDIESTNKIFAASKIMGLTLLDHIVIGDLNYTSLREEKMI